MGRLKPLAAVCATLALFVAGGSLAFHPVPRSLAAPAAGAGPELFGQSAARLFDREFPDPDISYLLLDAQSSALLASRWPAAERPIPLGSLVKPFAALAFAGHHDYRYPFYTCHGTAGGCWRPRPHGRMDITAALAFSCNAYFHRLALHLAAEDLQEVAARFDLDPPPPGLSVAGLFGGGSNWPVSPLRMARAFLELTRHPDEPGVREILRGLAGSARIGTAAAVDAALPRADAMAKTGTAPCSHLPRAPGDGFVVVLSPAAQPKLLLMLRLHGAPGSAAAVLAGRMLSRLEE